MPKRIEVKVGKEYGRLVVIKEVEQKKNKRRFLCKCACGKIKPYFLIKLTTGRTKSCGCLAKEVLLANNTTHGLSYHPLYNVWNSMRQRCSNKNAHAYCRYGGRDITVCLKWQNFKRFYDWAVSNGYQKGLTIERVENSGNYNSDNCTWIPLEQQARNRRNNKIVEYNGKSMILADWSKEIGINQTVLSKRLLHGWSIEKAFTTPLRVCINA